MLGDILRDTWAYQEIMEEGREEGREEGLQKGLQKGLKEGLQKGLREGLQEGLKEGLYEGMKEGLQALRHILLTITQTSFPELETIARRKAVLITEPKVLEDVTLKMLAARTSEEARQVLNDIATIE